MDAGTSNPTSAVKNRLKVERKSDRELLVTRSVNAPPRIVFEAWTKPALFQRWWVPKSLGMNLLSCELDVRQGGTYRLVFQHPAFPDGMAFHGKYLEVVPPTRIVWTNEEAGGSGQVTTVNFEAHGEQTLVVVHELYATKEALDEELSTGSLAWNDESFDQLDDLLGSA